MSDFVAQHAGHDLIIVCSDGSVTQYKSPPKLDAECKVEDPVMVIHRAGDLLHSCFAGHLPCLLEGIPGISEAEKDTIFAMLANVSVPGMMYEMLRSAIDGVATCDEVVVQLKGTVDTGLVDLDEACLNPLIPVCVVQRLHVCHGSTYVLDIIGAHTDGQLTILPWDEAKEKYLVGVLQTHDFGASAMHFEAGQDMNLAHVKEHGSMGNMDKMALLIDRQWASTKLALEAGLNAVEGASDFGALIRLPADKYEQAKEKFLGAWNETLAAQTEWLEMTKRREGRFSRFWHYVVQLLLH